LEVRINATSAPPLMILFSSNSKPMSCGAEPGSGDPAADYGRDEERGADELANARRARV
jgi:hypothetical protein